MVRSRLSDRGLDEPQRHHLHYQGRPPGAVWLGVADGTMLPLRPAVGNGL
jgi:hypothetical protein